MLFAKIMFVGLMTLGAHALAEPEVVASGHLSPSTASSEVTSAGDLGPATFAAVTTKPIEVIPSALTTMATVVSSAADSASTTSLTLSNGNGSTPDAPATNWMLQCYGISAWTCYFNYGAHCDANGVVILNRAPSPGQWQCKSGFNGGTCYCVTHCTVMWDDLDSPEGGLEKRYSTCN